MPREDIDAQPVETSTGKKRKAFELTLGFVGLAGALEAAVKIAAGQPQRLCRALLATARAREARASAARAAAPLAVELGNQSQGVPCFVAKARALHEQGFY